MYMQPDRYFESLRQFVYEVSGGQVVIKKAGDVYQVSKPLAADQVVFITHGDIDVDKDRLAGIVAALLDDDTE